MQKVSGNDLTAAQPDGAIPAATTSDGVGSSDPAWYTPGRLLVAFCVVSFLVFLDRGIIASNGVNGDKESKTGIQVCLLSALAMISATHYAIEHATATVMCNAKRIRCTAAMHHRQCTSPPAR